MIHSERFYELPEWERHAMVQDLFQRCVWEGHKYQARRRAERLAWWKETAGDVLMVVSGFLWFFGLLALAGILM